ncbi:hypothetical protein VSS37_06615 [Candidatus Thiothrix sp. Deng01]|uniref:Uncharacterized protein n=1 Tax=Candidatus Thiothrix phosphatis TaxID=3112415 RepID=A0ABU6CX02_9GAMM|nr:hypothetical protein [Candidatus Thiothrix sp. Deng01]MEB4590644.1 hypothetical protein [Candidatus Thiothrix sp. Deng01]
MSALEELKARKQAREEEKASAQEAGNNDALIQGVLVPFKHWRNNKPVRVYILMNPVAVTNDLLDVAIDEAEKTTGMKLDVYEKYNTSDGGNQKKPWAPRT